MNNKRIESTLKALCKKHHFFNAGTDAQYERMCELAKAAVTEFNQIGNQRHITDRLTDVIWVCSSDEETEGDVNRNDVLAAVRKWLLQMEETVL